MDRCPIVRIAVLPVPMPRCTRPGASRFSVAIAPACTGGIRVPQMAVPGPRRIRHVWRGQGQHGVTVREDHLAVGDPDRVVAEAIRPLPPRELTGSILSDALTPDPYPVHSLTHGGP